MPFRDPQKSVVQKLRASNHDPTNPSSILHPALNLAFFTPAAKVAPNMGVAVVLASDTSRYEGEWHQLKPLEEAVLRQAFASSHKSAPKASRAESLSAGIAPPKSPTLQNFCDATPTSLPASTPRSTSTPRSVLSTPCSLVDAAGFQAAMKSIGRLLTLEEAHSLVYYFDTNGNGAVEFKEFQRGVERLVGTGFPHGSGKEYQSQQIPARRCVYVGDFYDDKRHGFGLYKVKEKLQSPLRDFTFPLALHMICL
jgi:hypothetical protein